MSFAHLLQKGDDAGAHQAIVSVVVFDVVKSELSSRRTQQSPRGERRARGGHKHAGLLGLLVCGGCHRPMSTSVSHRGPVRYRYYRWRSNPQDRVSQYPQTQEPVAARQPTQFAHRSATSFVPLKANRFPMSQVRAGAAFVELTLKNSAMVKGLRSAQKQLSSFASSTSMMGAKLTGLGVAMAAPLGDGIRKFAEYDDAIRQVGAITGATGAAFDRLNAKAKQLGATTSFSAVEVANLMTELGRAGFDSRQIEDMTGIQIKIRQSHRGWMRQYKVENGTPMPFDSKPDAAFKVCMQKTCTQLVAGGLLAKCPALAYFAQLEAKLNLHDLPQWQLFRDYKAITPAATDDELRTFIQTKAIPQCGLCPSKRTAFVHPNPLQRTAE
ncbi:hypothetical protein LF1_05780 [Rubripirellula obstinata]|uniref:Uncharacterized protein n=1 Tax=Rubripirellula obstinata TaxID=406547 RepID=A0A5B1CF20_9BACT|nr:phage tail tape measure protein [Rubripirellula obstinata]KAA1258063.1 hypothetical protein LF1_05780 [Rubripirellula obstinata]